MAERIKLAIELIPKTCHYINARQKLKPAQWNAVRKYIYHKANYRCEICGLTGKQQGFRVNLECHEAWLFKNSTHTQKLVGLVALCPLCHQTKHFGRSSMMGRQPQVFKQFENVNNWTHKEAVQHVAESVIECKERAKYYWKLDLSILLKPPFNVKLKTKKKKYTYKKQSKRRMN